MRSETGKEILLDAGRPGEPPDGSVVQPVYQMILGGAVNGNHDTTTPMYAMGKRIYFSKGSQDNIKIITKEDLSLFEGYVLEQQRKSRKKTAGDVIVYLADGFEECEALIVVDLLRRAELAVVMASVMGRRNVKSSRGILVTADCLAENVDDSSSRLIVLPGGRMGTENLGEERLGERKMH